MTNVLGSRVLSWSLPIGACILLLAGGWGEALGQCTNYNNYLHTVASLPMTPGNPTDIAFHGNYAYVVDAIRDAGAASAIHVVDLSNPGQPVVVSSVTGLVIVPSSIFISGDRAYVTSDYHQQIGRPLSIFDISNPTFPQQIAAAGGALDSKDVIVAGDRAFVSISNENELIVYNISNLPTITVSGLLSLAPTPPGKMVLGGNYLYVTNSTAGIRVVDVSDPDTPTIVATIALTCFSDLVLSDGILYAVAGGSLYTIDVSDPLQPSILGSAPSGINDTPMYLAKSGEQCFLSASTHNILVFNVSNPVAPVSGTIIPKGLGAELQSLVVSGSLLYEARLGYGLTMTSISSPEPLTPIGELQTGGDARAVVVSQDRVDVAYVADGVGGFRVIDVTNPQTPVLLHTVPTAGNAADITVLGNTAYVADSAAGLQIYNVADPFGTAPSWLGGAPTADLAVGVAVVDSLAYVADTDGGLRIFNVKFPTAPTALGFNDTLSAAQSVEVAGNYAYVADGDGGLRTLNVSDPDNPWLIGNIKSRTAVTALDVALSGSRAYVAAGDSGLVIMEVSNPADLVELGRIGTGDAALAVKVAGTYAYVADNASGLRVYDIQDPAAPLFLGSVDVPNNSQGVFITENYAYVAAGAAGLQICPSQCGYTAAVTADFTTDVSEAFYPALIHFTNYSTGYAASYHWDFGDGVGVSSSINPSYYYDAPGDYTVTLTVTGSGNTDVMTRKIYILAEEPRISAVADAPNDQGGWVYVDFHHSGYDDTMPNRSEIYTIQSQDDGVWVTLATTGAYGDPTYRVLVPTRANGADSAKPYRVIAHMDEGIWISEPLGGYSEDNIAPGSPADVVWQAADLLDWAPAAANDLDHYEIYGADTPDFSTAELIVAVTESQVSLDASAHAWVFVVAVDVNGLVSAPSTPLTVTGVAELPAVLALGRAHPNPFNPATTISYALPNSGHVRLAIFDLGGRLVSRLVDGPQEAGHHATVWRGRDDTGRPVPSGAYIYRLEAAGASLSRRMTLLK